MTRNAAPFETPEPVRHPDTREVPRLPPGVMGIIVAAIVALVAVGVMLDISRDPQRRQERQRRLDQHNLQLRACLAQPGVPYFDTQGLFKACQGVGQEPPWWVGR